MFAAPNGLRLHAYALEGTATGCQTLDGTDPHVLRPPINFIKLRTVTTLGFGYAIAILRIDAIASHDVGIRTVNRNNASTTLAPGLAPLCVALRTSWVITEGQICVARFKTASARTRTPGDASGKPDEGHWSHFFYYYVARLASPWGGRGGLATVMSSAPVGLARLRLGWLMLWHP